MSSPLSAGKHLINTEKQIAREEESFFIYLEFYLTFSYLILKVEGVCFY